MPPDSGGLWLPRCALRLPAGYVFAAPVGYSGLLRRKPAHPCFALLGVTLVTDGWRAPALGRAVGCPPVFSIRQHIRAPVGRVRER